MANQTLDTVATRVKDLFDLSGRVAIVTGGAGLLGPLHGSILAAAGAHVVLLDLPKKKAANSADKLKNEYGVECLGLTTDITSEREIEQARDTVLKRFNRVDILINNA